MRIGFEPNRNRVVRVMNHKPVTANINGTNYRFRSQFEFEWACYLELIRRQGYIREWDYEPKRFDFWEFGYRNKPYEYTPDFLVIERNGDEVYQECKGMFETKDISRITRAKKHFGLTFDLVLQRFPKRSGKGAHLLAKVTQKVRRVIDGTAVLRQAGNVVGHVNAEILL